MTDVYVLVERDYDGDEVHGVYSSLAQAQGQVPVDVKWTQDRDHVTTPGRVEEVDLMPSWSATVREKKAVSKTLGKRILSLQILVFTLDALADGLEGVEAT